MKVAEFCKAYPRVYHMAEDGSWPLILKLGLLSTASLLLEFGASDELTSKTTGGIRPAIVEVTAPDGSRAWIRDQLPMRLARLEGCLRGVSVAEWLQLLNSHVFFWVREERLLTLLNARAYRKRKHTVLVLRSDVLLDRHASEVRLTPMNTGSTIYVPRPRGVGTFSRVEDFDFQARRKRAGRNAVVELAVRDRVHIDDAILESVARCDGGTRIETLYP